MASAPRFELSGRRRRMALSLAPLIDVTFILLIFFMLVTQYTRLAPVDVTLGEISQVKVPEQTEEAPEMKAQNRLTLRADGSLDLDGEALAGLAQLGPALQKLGPPRLQAAMIPGGDAPERPVLLLAPEGGVKLQLLIDALAALEQVEGLAVRIAIPRQEAAP